jgi:hypothetical protein
LIVKTLNIINKLIKMGNCSGFCMSSN